MKQAPIKLPFKVDPAPRFDVKRQDDGGPSAAELWLEGIKHQARDNIDNGFEFLRISWHNRWKRPRHDKFDDYTPEEIILETWEQYYFDHPDSLELKGIYKRKNKKTGYSYYVTGDPLLDQMEAAFGRGETPDLSVLNNVSKGRGKDIFREHVFQHTERVIGGRASPGDMVAPRKGVQGVQTTPDGAKITATGAKVTHDDYQSDEWLKDMLKSDPGLAAIAEKVKNGS